MKSVPALSEMSITWCKEPKKITTIAQPKGKATKKIREVEISEDDSDVEVKLIRKKKDSKESKGKAIRSLKTLPSPSGHISEADSSEEDISVFALRGL